MAKKMNFSQAMELAIQNIGDAIDDDVRKKAIGHVAQSAGRIIENELKAAGIKSSKSTGTANKRSASEKRDVAKQGSITDPTNRRTVHYDSVDLAYAGFGAANAYRARFRNSGISTHKLWSSDKAGSFASDGPTNFMDNAAKVIQQDSMSIIERALVQAFNDVKPVNAESKNSK